MFLIRWVTEHRQANDIFDVELGWQLSEYPSNSSSNKQQEG